MASLASSDASRVPVCAGTSPAPNSVSCIGIPGVRDKRGGNLQDVPGRGCQRSRAWIAPAHLATPSCTAVGLSLYPPNPQFLMYTLRIIMGPPGLRVKSFNPLCTGLDEAYSGPL